MPTVTAADPSVEIVGAGFAGFACAHACAGRGVPTVVWERKADPGQAIHTTGLLVKEVADALDVPRAITRRIAGIRLYGPSHRWIDLDEPGYSFLATDTPALMRWLAERACEAGADIRCRRAFPGRRTAAILVGADGPRSGVARAAGLGTNRSFLAGVEAEFEPLPGLAERLHVFSILGWHRATSDGSFPGSGSRRSASPADSRLDRTSMRSSARSPTS
jgi:flavin-dependent dehydrogenase